MRAIPAVAVTILLASFVAGAQGGAGGQQQPPPAPPPPGTPTKPLVPLAASTFAATPEKYVGEFVSLTGTVEQSVAKLAFTVDQDAKKTTGKDILVLMRNLSGTI